MSLERFLGLSLADAERALILQALEDCGGNRTWAARRLKVSVRALRNKISLSSDQGCNIPLPADSSELAAKGADRPRDHVHG